MWPPRARRPPSISDDQSAVAVAAAAAAVALDIAADYVHVWTRVADVATDDESVAPLAAAAAVADYDDYDCDADVVMLLLRVMVVVVVLASDYRSAICVNPSVNIGPATFWSKHTHKYTERQAPNTHNIHTHTQNSLTRLQTHENGEHINYKYGPTHNSKHPQVVKWAEWGWLDGCMLRMGFP